MPKVRAFPTIPIAIFVALSAAVWAAIFLPNSRDTWVGQQADGPANILSAELKRDYQNGILKIEFTFDNSTKDPVRLEPPAVRLISKTPSSAIHLYSLDAASDPDPVVPAGQRKTVTLSYWLEPVHFTGAIDLIIADSTFPIKSNTPFDIQTVKNQSTLTLTSPDWQP